MCVNVFSFDLKVLAAYTDKKREIPRSPTVAKSVVGSDKKSSRHAISLTANKSSGTSPPQLKEKKLATDSKATVDATLPGRVAKVSLGPLSDWSISWDSLRMNIQELGKVHCQAN